MSHSQEVNRKTKAIGLQHLMSRRMMRMRMRGLQMQSSWLLRRSVSSEVLLRLIALCVLVAGL